ncbi:DUF1365 family protein [Niveispirillum sp. SYP-B3756]|uniref:DUF1365 domain-containing protein n=1 Tax=Niveispirillum sp. SYP-B3756 TaxID=2662178 RepID=UPI001290F820|nr:DUF1365 domain-containing protein [Niveispirillum sp. SYP-B3756]MQP65750.1 DUF1365 family protein [Niveispirillum sp. SYP-B3756]
MAAAEPDHALYLCRVFHARHRPFRHAFSYRLYTLLLDIDRLDHLPWPLVHERPGLLSIRARDHGRRDGSPLRPWVEEMLAEKGVVLKGGRILMLAMPRVLGYAFNPLTVYYCHGPDGRLRALLYEVKNTFGDQHCYTVPTPGGWDARQGARHAHGKEFHVSPFFDIAGDYHFRTGQPGDKLALDIRLVDGDGELLVATQTGRRLPLTRASLWRALFLHPLVTLKAIAAIHWQAWHLWRKGAKFHRRPDPPVRRETKPTDVGTGT